MLSLPATSFDHRNDRSNLCRRRYDAAYLTTSIYPNSRNDEHMMFDEKSEACVDEQYQYSLRYEDLEMAGPPVQPLDFPTPTVNRAAHISGRMVDHRSGQILDVTNALIRVPDRPNAMADRAYLVRRKLAKTVYGSVRLCTVLRKRMTIYNGTMEAAEWKSTDETVVLKASAWSSIHQKRGKHLEDPLKEAACLQYLGNYHENVLGCLEVLQDSDYLYVVMPYCNDGSLYSRVTEKRQSSSTRSNGSTRSAGSSRHHNLSRHTKVERCRRRYVDYQHEELVRGWFLQLLQALSHLQKKGVCHRDLCLENILLLDDHNLVLTDCGLSLRIPYDDESNHGAISDVSQGYQRRLIKSQGQCGRLTYLAPEIIEGDLGFDGFATDLWSAGVILFTCLVGLAPFKWPHPSDCHYSIINQGKLQLLVNEFDIAISDEACDLLQNMFWRNPKKRLVLSEVYAHPWVVGRKERKEYSSFEENSSSPHQSKSVVNPVPTARRPSLLQSVTTTDENSI